MERSAALKARACVLVCVCVCVQLCACVREMDKGEELCLKPSRGAFWWLPPRPRPPLPGSPRGENAS